ncbi:N-6 DNA methylase [Sphaerisporangium aureirubrum]|uniref:N-6 DNA methylase n=1 Tax=Sphaerisporangium aureirubrum TaxID=1544736 RepID=A0ABW1NK41_9ACTN
MPDSVDAPVSVTLAEIARLAGVGRAAVSNWRRRHESFPAPVGGTDTSPQFALPQVEGWLRRQGKLPTGFRGRDRLWPQFEALGDRDAMGRAIVAAGSRFSPGRLSSPSADSYTSIASLGGELSEAQRALVDQAVEVARQDGSYETFEFLLRRWLETHVRQIPATPAPLAELMTEIVELFRDGHERFIRTVLDPACGVGSLLAAAATRWREKVRVDGGAVLTLLGQESDAAMAALAATRLSLALLRDEPKATQDDQQVDVQPGDALRAEAHGDARADVVLCNPPFNERDWGYEELSADPRWTYGLPPRTESELAWVQLALARLAPGGTAVLLLPPGVASRKAGRRIRTNLLRTGALRSVIALPPGSAPPHGITLHLWVLRAPAEDGVVDADASVLFVDAASERSGVAATSGGRPGIDWPALHDDVLTALRANLDGEGPSSSRDPYFDSDREDEVCDVVSVPVLDLLDDEVDLTPARRVPAAASAAGLALRRSWTRFNTLLNEVRDLGSMLSRLDLGAGNDTAPGAVTVGDLVKRGALTLRAGQQPPEGRVRGGEAPPGAVPVFTVPDVLLGAHPSGWMPAEEVAEGEAGDALTVTVPDDVVVTGVHRAFGAWVDSDAPTVLGPQMYALRVDPAALDPWFVAGCLRAPANARRAGTHASVSARIDVRRLQVLMLPLAEQRAYAETFRRIAAFDEALREAAVVGKALVDGLSDGLAAGRPAREGRW